MVTQSEQGIVLLRRIARSATSLPPWARWSALLVASTLAMGLVNFAFGLLVARLGGEAVWSAASPLLAAGTAGSFAGLGIEYAVTRSVMRGEGWRSVLRRVLPLASALVVLFGLSFLVASPVATFLHFSSTAPVPLCVALFGATVLLAVPSGLLVGSKRIGLLALLGVTIALARVGFLWVVPGSLVERSLLASSISIVLGGAAMLVVSAKGSGRGEETEGFGRIATTGSLARVGLWVTIVAPVVVARHFLPLRAAGELATVTYIASSIAYMAAPVATAFFPVMLVDRARRHLRNGLLVSLGLVIAGTAVVVPVGPWLLHLLYHTKQPDLTWLLAFGCVGVVFQTASGFLVWAALARSDSVRAVYAGTFGALPLVGLLVVFHSSPAALLVAALPSMASIGLITQVVGVRRRSRTRITATSPRSGVHAVGSRPSLSQCSVGVMAHNEERTIVRCLRSLLDARGEDGAQVREVVVVISGTDRTEAMVRHLAANDRRLRVLRQEGTVGKAAAINLFLSATTGNLLILSSADVVLKDAKLADLVAPLSDPRVGMCGGAVVPTNPKKGLTNRLVHLLWELHSSVAMVCPKLGEIVAFRRCFETIEASSTVDEVSIEERVTRAGYLLHFAHDVAVHNHGPTRLGDYIRHRYRINRGHLAVRTSSGYETSTSSASLVMRVAGATALRRPSLIPLLCIAAAVEGATRGAAWAVQLIKGAPSSGQFPRLDSAKVALSAIATVRDNAS